MNLLENRLIAFLDVLGFSKMLEERSLEDIYMKYSSFINDAKTKYFKADPTGSGQSTNFEHGKFISDSIILISHPIDNTYNINNFVTAVNNLLGLGFANEFPLRGAVGIGDIIVDDENGGFISKKIPDLVKAEQNQDWTGCILLENAIDIVLESVGGKEYKTQIMDKPIKDSLFHFYPIPTKNTAISSFVFNFSHLLGTTKRNQSLEYLIDPKKSNVCKYINYLNSLPSDPNTKIPENMRLIKLRTSMVMTIVED